MSLSLNSVKKSQVSGQILTELTESCQTKSRNNVRFHPLLSGGY